MSSRLFLTASVQIIQPKEASFNLSPTFLPKRMQVHRQHTWLLMFPLVVHRMFPKLRVLKLMTVTVTTDLPLLGVPLFGELESLSITQVCYFDRNHEAGSHGLSQCPALTDDRLELLINVPSLRSLTLDFCEKVLLYAFCPILTCAADLR
jgi:hypothetical protein